MLQLRPANPLQHDSISVDELATPEVNVFTAGNTGAGQQWHSSISFFYQISCPTVPSEASATFSSIFSIVSVPDKVKVNVLTPVTLEDANGDDDPSIQKQPLSDAVNYILDEIDQDNLEESGKADVINSDIDVDEDDYGSSEEDEPDEVVPKPWPPKKSQKDSAPHDGKAREAPPVLAVYQAVKDLETLLRGESKDKGDSYKDPKINPFIQYRIEGMHTFLNHYSNPRSRTYAEWG